MIGTRGPRRRSGERQGQGLQRGHPFHRDNNVEGIDGDTSGTPFGARVRPLAIERWNRRYDGVRSHNSPGPSAAGSRGGAADRGGLRRHAPPLASGGRITDGPIIQAGIALGGPFRRRRRWLAGVYCHVAPRKSSPLPAGDRRIERRGMGCRGGFRASRSGSPEVCRLGNHAGCGRCRQEILDRSQHRRMASRPMEEGSHRIPYVSAYAETCRAFQRGRVRRSTAGSACEWSDCIRQGHVRLLLLSEYARADASEPLV